MNKRIILFYLILVLYSCTHTKQFIVYPKNINIDTNNYEYLTENFTLYFDSSNIHSEYIEIAVIATNTYYYGQFFFDKLFMSLLEKKVYSLNGNAVLYEKGKNDYENYNSNYLYFTVLYIKE
mgnify:CR=1 FL=1